MTNNSQDNPIAETPLESWKEIASYLQRDVRTVIRWEKAERLPVHRHHHLSRSSVYAYPSELEAWRANRQPLAESTRYKWWRPVPAFASMITLSLALMMAGSGPRVGALVQAADGIVTRQVWTGPDASAYHSPSPDGRYLGFTDRAEELAVHDLTTGENRRLTNKNSGRENQLEFATDSVFSPDGKRVAFAWANQREELELHVVGMDGSEPRVLYRSDKYDIMPSDWSPDGKLILASLNRLQAEGNRPWAGQIVTVDAADGSLTILKTFDGNGPDRKRMRFSADGRFVAYDSTAGQEGNLDIFALSVSSGQVTPLVQHPAQDKMLGWAPDGKSVLFLSDRTGDWGAWLIAVADGRPQGEPKLVKRNVGAIMPMGFTRDGSLYYGESIGPGYNVYTATLDGGEPSLLVKRFLGRNSEPTWSPDGESIAYRRFSPEDAPTTLCVRSVETGREREYSLSLKGFRYLQWSPDGKSMLMIGTDLRGQTGSYQVDLETGQVVAAHVNRHGSWVVIPRWSADGRAFYYIEPHVEETKRPARVVRRDLGAGRDEEMRQLPEGVTTGWVLPSPDGGQLAMWLTRGQQGSLAVMPTGGTEIRELLGPRTGVVRGTLAWRPDSRQIMFFRRVGRPGEEVRFELWGVPVEGGEPRSLGFSISFQGVNNLAVHPDGKQIAFEAHERGTTEIWVMENFLPGSEAAGQ